MCHFNSSWWVTELAMAAEVEDEHMRPTGNGRPPRDLASGDGAREAGSKMTGRFVSGQHRRRGDVSMAKARVLRVQQEKLRSQF